MRCVDIRGMSVFMSQEIGEIRGTVGSKVSALEVFMRF